MTPSATIPDCPRIGALQAGARDAISDVCGVTVGHCTLDDGDLQTGVTVVRPHAGDAFVHRVPAGVAVINGFGKSVGLLQVEELGVLETPIALTNTFSVPAMAAAQIRACIARHPECGRTLPTVNALVFECNDAHLNDIQRMALTEDHHLAALAAAAEHVMQGSVGAGRGMTCFGLKGGIGTSSRRVALADGRAFVVGALVLANFGVPANLVVAGWPLGAHLGAQSAAQGSTRKAAAPDTGSIILLLATDAPLDARQLRRVALRAGAGLARTGSVFGHGSGDIALAFSTAYTLPLRVHEPMPAVALLHDAWLDGLFQAAADACEQSILHALWHAKSVRGRNGHTRVALTERLAGWPVDAFTAPRTRLPSP